MWVALCFCSIRGVDTGDIVAQERIPVEKGDSFMTLSWKGMIRIAQLQAAALEAVRLESPRGSFRFSKAHNPIQDIYLREVKGGEQKLLGVALKEALDPAAGCAMVK